MMILKQRVIKKVLPTYVWMHGNTKLELRTIPCYNLNIITKDNVKCYAIDKKEFDRFVKQWQNYHDIGWNVRKAKEAVGKYFDAKTDTMKRFYLSVYNHYKEHLERF